jgi:HK97 family phage portal protein
MERIGSVLRQLGRKGGPPPGGYASSWGGGSFWSDAFRTRRAPAPAELVDSYKSLVYACVNLNAQAVARTPLRLYAVTRSGQPRAKCPVRPVSRKARGRLGGLAYASKLTAGAERVEEVTGHPLLETVMKVSDDLDHVQLLAYTVMSLEIVGSAYWWPSPGPYGLPDELWALPPHLVYPVFDGGSLVPRSYVFGGVEYARDQLVRFRRLSAKNPYGQGYGPEQAAIEYARLEDTFVSIQENMLANGPRPSLIVSHKDPKGTFGAAERQRLEVDMERRGRGGRAGGVFVVDGAAAVTPISYSPTDLGGLDVATYDLERIANCFDVPISMLRTQDVNRANAEAGLVQHGRNAVEPRCKLIASTLTRWTHSLDRAGLRGFDRLFWAFDPVVHEDRLAEAELHRTYLDLGVVTRNEVRLELGYAPAEGADELLVPDSLSPLGAVAGRAGR